MEAAVDYNIAWQPNPGSQTMFMQCPVFECLYEGTRGPGKSESLIMDFCQHVGQGFGSGWRGVIFRRSYPELDELRDRSGKLIHKIFPRAKYNAGNNTWFFPDGEQLKFRYVMRDSDYWRYHGHEYPFVGFDELQTWPTLDIYHIMKSICRSSKPGMPRKYRATANPYGVGHGAIKAYFIDPLKPGSVVKDDQGNPRTRVRGFYWENQALMENDPDYIRRIRSDSNEARRRAWTMGDWDIIAGGFFESAWDITWNVLDDFEPPEHWMFRRGFDWGYTRPSSLGIWAISPGEVVGDRYFPKNSLVRVDEWYPVKRDRYGASIPNDGQMFSNFEQGRAIAEVWPSKKYFADQADPSIFTEQGGDSIYDQIRRGSQSMGVDLNFYAADNARHPGWQKMLEMMKAAHSERPEQAGLYVSSQCKDFLRTVPVLMRDSKDPDDVDTEQEDHIGDETRYVVQSVGTREVKKSKLRGA